MRRFGPFNAMASICCGSGVLERHIAHHYMQGTPSYIEGTDEVRPNRGSHHQRPIQSRDSLGPRRPRLANSRLSVCPRLLIGVGWGFRSPASNEAVSPASASGWCGQRAGRTSHYGATADANSTIPAKSAALRTSFSRKSALTMAGVSAKQLLDNSIDVGYVAA
jgi:hypothetical protein